MLNSRSRKYLSRNPSRLCSTPEVRLNHFPLDPALGGAFGMTGIDEAGRGSLAGPVVVASLTWHPDQVCDQPWFSACADSKTLDAATRRELLPHLLSAAAYVRVAVIHPILIDLLNILRATLHGFELVAPDFHPRIPLIIDGNQKPPSLSWAKTQVKGDQQVSAIAAAGIVVKQVRDQLLVEADRSFPGYGLATHKGYATQTHRRALAELGPSACHRKSFRPVKDCFSEETCWGEPLTWARVSAGCSPSQAWAAFQQHYHRLPLREDRLAVAWLHDHRHFVVPQCAELAPAWVRDLSRCVPHLSKPADWQDLPLFSR